jgi:hypothetical protein
MNDLLNRPARRSRSRSSAIVKEVGYQSWTPKNLTIESYHNDILYFTSRWDALCPYIAVNEDLLQSAPRPFIVYAVPPDSRYGVPINDYYGLVEVSAPDFESHPKRSKRFRVLDKQYRDFTHTETVVPGHELTLDGLLTMGQDHFRDCYIDEREVAGFVDYVRNLDVLVLQVHAPTGELVLTDVSILLPDYQQVYGSFCQWNRDFKSRSPGIYACVLASRWAARHGYRFYNLGPVGDYGYKSLFVTHLEPIFALVLTEDSHPLALDTSSPLHMDFKREEWNQIYRPASAAGSEEPFPVSEDFFNPTGHATPETSEAG